MKNLLKNSELSMAIVLLASAFLMSQPAVAASPCPISFQLGTPVTTVDGQLDAEWNDAQVFESGSACLSQLLDSDDTFRDVRIHSKSFMSSGSDRVLALFFEVEDESDSFDIGFTEGERIIINVDPDMTGGAAMNASDFKFEFRHIWQAVSAGSDDIVVNQTVYDGGGGPSLCPTPHATWLVATPTVAAANAARLMFNPSDPTDQIGYTLEVLISETDVGAMSGDIGISIGIINDWQECTATGVCDDHGVSFPQALPMTNTDNPLAAVGCGFSWDIPNDWATGYLNSFVGDVYFSHVPKFWRSEDIDGLACTDVTENSYYPDTPCRLRIRSRSRNSSSTDQVRNLLYLFGVHAAGSTTWNDVQLREDVVMASDVLPTDVITETTSIFANDSEVASVSGIVGAHPCVRVYILPPSISSDFDRSRMASISSGSDITDLVNAYGLEPRHSAQQNISRQAETAVCPQTGCEIIGQAEDLFEFAIADASGAVSRAMPANRASALGQSLYPSTITSTQSLIPAQISDPIGGGDRPPPIRGGERPPLLTDTRGLENFLRTDVIIEVMALGYREPSGGDPYNLLEVVGGIVNMVPVVQLDPQQGAVINFQVNNPNDVPMWIRLSPTMRTPPGYENVKLILDTSAKLYQPDETRTFTSRVTPQNPEPGTSPWSWSIHAGPNDPRGGLSSNFDAGSGFGIDLMYDLNTRWSIEGYLGREQFDGVAAIPDRDIDMLTVSGRAYANAGSNRVFAGVGIGYYSLDLGGGTGLNDDGFGTSLSAGIEVPVQPRLKFEATIRWHKINVGGDPEFLQYQVGIRVPF